MNILVHRLFLFIRESVVPLFALLPFEKTGETFAFISGQIHYFLRSEPFKAHFFGFREDW